MLNPFTINKMKKLSLFVLLSLLLLTCSLLSGCFSDNSEFALHDQSVTETTGRILNKEYSSFRGIHHYKLYIFDGNEANWFDCGENLYDSVKLNDTMKLVVLTKTYFKSNCDVKK